MTRVFMSLVKNNNKTRTKVGRVIVRGHDPNLLH